MGGLIGGNLFVEGSIARLMYISNYTLHLAALHGWPRVALHSLGRFLRERTEPRSSCIDDDGAIDSVRASLLRANTGHRAAGADIGRGFGVRPQCRRRRAQVARRSDGETGSAARDEERDKDRRMREQAMKDAERLMRRSRRPTLRRPAADAAIVDTAANTSTRQEQGAAPFLARLKATLVDPESMQIRDLSLRENASALCVEINARNRAGDYIGYTPVIVTVTACSSTRSRAMSSMPGSRPRRPNS
jgi:hypothetical protein